MKLNGLEVVDIIGETSYNNSVAVYARMHSAHDRYSRMEQAPVPRAACAPKPRGPHGCRENAGRYSRVNIPPDPFTKGIFWLGGVSVLYAEDAAGEGAGEVHKKSEGIGYCRRRSDT